MDRGAPKPTGPMPLGHERWIDSTAVRWMLPDSTSVVKK